MFNRKIDPELINKFDEVLLDDGMVVRVTGSEPSDDGSSEHVFIGETLNQGERNYERWFRPEAVVRILHKAADQ